MSAGVFGLLSLEAGEAVFADGAEEKARAPATVLTPPFRLASHSSKKEELWVLEGAPDALGLAVSEPGVPANPPGIPAVFKAEGNPKL